MCFPQNIQMPAFFRPPAADSNETNRRVQDATRPNPGMTSILTSALGDPNFGKNINRTVLTGAIA